MADARIELAIEAGGQSSPRKRAREADAGGCDRALIAGPNSRRILCQAASIVESSEHLALAPVRR